MAIVQTGATQTFTALGNGNTGTVSTTITVPADAELVVVGWSGFNTTTLFFSSGSMTFTKGGSDTAMTSVAGGDTATSNWACGYFYQFLPDTGSNKSLKWDWAGTGTAGDTSNVCTVTFWKGVDTSGVRGTGAGQSGANTPYTTGTITAVSGDLIIAMVGAFTTGTGSVNTWSGLTSVTQTNSASAFGAIATGSPSGNTTVAASTDTNLDDGSIVAVSFKASASGAPFFKQWDRPQYDIYGAPPPPFVRNPSQFPNPIPFSDQQQRHTNAVKLSVPRDYVRDPFKFPNPIPFNQLSWVPVEQPYRSFSPDAVNYTILTSVVVASPFTQLNWVASSKPRVTLTDASDPSEMWLFPPFTPVDFSRQFYPEGLPSGIQQTNINLFTNPIPFGPFSFPPITAIQGKASDVVQPWQNFYTVITAPPFAQYDWSTTRFQTPRAPDASQPLGVSQLIGSTQAMLLDWSGSGYMIRSNRAFDQPYNQLLYGVVVQAAPFVPVDFSRPFAIPLAKVDAQSVNTNLFTNPVPLNQIDWSKPYRIVPIASDQNSLPNIILYQPVPSNPSNPLGIYSWLDLYKYVTLYPTTPALLQNLTLILPPPPPDTGPVGGWRWIDGVMRMREKQLDRRDQSHDIRKAAAVLSKMGGIARAQALTANQRSNIASKAAQARWNPPPKKR